MLVKLVWDCFDLLWLLFGCLVLHVFGGFGGICLVDQLLCLRLFGCFTVFCVASVSGLFVVAGLLYLHYCLLFWCVDLVCVCGLFYCVLLFDDVVACCYICLLAGCHLLGLVFLLFRGIVFGGIIVWVF